MKSIARKQKFGEVFTPTKIIREIFEEVEIDWKNEKDVFQDISAGDGQIIVEIFKK